MSEMPSIVMNRKVRVLGAHQDGSFEYFIFPLSLAPTTTAKCSHVPFSCLLQMLSFVSVLVLVPVMAATTIQTRSLQEASVPSSDCVCVCSSCCYGGGENSGAIVCQLWVCSPRHLLLFNYNSPCGPNCILPSMNIRQHMNSRTLS